MIRKPYIPREYQHLAQAFMLENERCALWAGPGLGKTVATETVLDIFNLSGEDEPAIVLGPMRVARKVWGDEAQKWDHLTDINVATITGTADQRLAALAKLKTSYTNTFACNYENLPWLVETLEGKWPFGKIIADESTKLKGFRIKQGSRRAHALGQVAFRSKRFIELSGTPAPNGLIDLWGQAWYLDAGQRLGRSFDAFQTRWFAWRRAADAANPGKTFMYRYIMPFASDQIHDALADICLSIDPRDYFDLKDPIDNPVWVDLGTKARIHYNEMEKEFFTQLEGNDIEAFTAATKSQKLLQIASGAMYLDRDVHDDTSQKAKQWKVVHEEKIEACESIVEELSGAPVMIAYHFNSTRERLLKAFPEARVLRSEKDEEDFKAGKIPQLLCHPTATGHGIDGFQDVCNNIVHVDHDWNLENYIQINERIGPVRQYQGGYDRAVFHHHILARDTVDESVMYRRAGKFSVQAALLERMRRKK